VGKRDGYRAELRRLRPEEWERFLAERSGLPGPRANLELVAAVGDEAPAEMVVRLAASDDEFLALCGAAAFGRLAVEGDAEALDELRRLASDPRWRVRKGVAIGLQRLGAVDIQRLLKEMRAWAGGTPLEQRAAVAALCEPPLLREPSAVRDVLVILDDITRSLASRSSIRSDGGFRVLRQALGYGWSVAVAALPEAGRPMMERWLASQDGDVGWVMRENLKKSRLNKMDAAWVKRLSGSG
jgi:hypothetical protein